MEITMIYDLQQPGATQSVESLMLRLFMDEPMELPLGDDHICYGYLHEVNPLPGGRLVELIFEIDDVFESEFMDQNEPLFIVEMA